MVENCDNCGKFTSDDGGEYSICDDCWYVRLHEYGVEWFIEVRKPVIRDQNYRCADCGMRQAECLDEYGRRLSVHHIEPRAEGGTDDPENLVALCSVCHARRENNLGGDRKV